jgi:hypothetical protein
LFLLLPWEDAFAYALIVDLPMDRNKCLIAQGHVANYFYPSGLD